MFVIFTIKPIHIENLRLFSGFSAKELTQNDKKSYTDPALAKSSVRVDSLKLENRRPGAVGAFFVPILLWRVVWEHFCAPLSIFSGTVNSVQPAAQSILIHCCGNFLRPTCRKEESCCFQ